MSEALVGIVREYIEDESAPYTVSDAIIDRWLNDSRGFVSDLQIYAEDYPDNESLIYKIGYKYLTNVVLKDGNGDVISDDDYTVDVFNGIVTFDGSPVVVPDAVYATFNFHDFFETVSQLWLYRAARARISGKAKLGDEDIPMGKESREYCIQKYWDFRQSKSFYLER